MSSEPKKKKKQIKTDMY